LDTWKARDPILRFRLYLEKKGLWTESYQKDAELRAKAAVDEAQKKAEMAAPADPKDMFTYTNASLTQRQMRQLKDF
ncbi:MAG TPA: thiamine pyrophosphate-dependent enzyme, partial [Nitrospirota bacterium]